MKSFKLFVSYQVFRNGIPYSISQTILEFSFQNLEIETEDSIMALIQEKLSTNLENSTDRVMITNIINLTNIFFGK